MPEGETFKRPPAHREAMRGAFHLFVAAALLAVGTLGTSAFNHAALTPRNVAVVVAGDGGAYLDVEANPSSPHNCFVDDAGAGRLAITFDATHGSCWASGGGAGINKGDGSDTNKWSRYAFHDILRITNRAPVPILVWINATTQSGGGSKLDVAWNADARTMTDASYFETAGSPIPLGTGEDLFVGVRVKSGTLATLDVAGKIEIDARRSD